MGRRNVAAHRRKNAHGRVPQSRHHPLYHRRKRTVHRPLCGITGVLDQRLLAGHPVYLYQETGDELYRREAEQAEEKLDCLLTLEKGGDAIDHDVGFLWHLSAGADELLTGNAQSRVRTRRAADLLMARFNPDGRFFTAWNGPERQAGPSLTR